MSGGTNTVAIGIGNTVVGNSTRSAGWVSISGSGTLWSNSGLVVVGNLGTNSLVDIDSGARVISSGLRLGSGVNSSNNQVIINQLFTVWTNSFDVIVGDLGSSNRLDVGSAGGLISSGGAVGAGSGSSNNVVVVDDLGSSWTNKGSLTVGLGGRFNSVAVSNLATLVTDTAIISAHSNAFNNSLTVANATLVGTNSNGAIDLLNVGQSNRGTFKLSWRQHHRRQSPGHQQLRLDHQFHL